MDINCGHSEPNPEKEPVKVSLDIETATFGGVINSQNIWMTFC